MGKERRSFSWAKSGGASHRQNAVALLIGKTRWRFSSAKRGRASTYLTIFRFSIIKFLSFLPSSRGSAREGRLKRVGSSGSAQAGRLKRVGSSGSAQAGRLKRDSSLKSSQLLYFDDTNQIVQVIQPDPPAAVDEPAVDEPAVDEPAVDEPAVDEPAVEEPAVEEPVVEVVAVNAPLIAFRLALPKARPVPTLLAFQEEDDNALKLTLPLLDIPPLVEPTQVTGKLAKPHILNAVEIGLGVAGRAAADCRIRNMRTSVASFIPVYSEDGFNDDLYSLKKRLIRLMWDGASLLEALCSAEVRATLSCGEFDEERSKILMDSIKYAAMFCVVTGGSLNEVLALSMSDMKCFGSVQAS